MANIMLVIDIVSVPMSRYDLEITDTQYIVLIQAKCNRTDINPSEWHSLLEKWIQTYRTQSDKSLIAAGFLSLKVCQHHTRAKAEINF